VRWGDSREVALKSIVAPGDVKERQRAPHVVQLAEDIRELGGEPGNPLWVKKVRQGWQLIAGRDRYSALALLGAKVAPVRVVEEATAQELHDLEVSENLHRRVDDRDALIRERVRKVTERVQAERANIGTNVPESPRKSAKVEAREIVAEQLGVTPAAIRKSEQRAKAREEGAARDSATGTEGQGRLTGALALPPPIETFGHALPEHVRADVEPVLAALRKVDVMLRQAQAAAKGLEVTTFERGAAAGIVEQLQRLGEHVRAVTPAALCPYCLGAAPTKAGNGCKACNTTGYVTRQVFESAPREKRHGNQPNKGAINGNEASEERGDARDADDGERGLRRDVREGGESSAALRGVAGAVQRGKAGDQAGPGARGGARPDVRPVASGEGVAGAGLLGASQKKPRGHRVVIVDEQGVEHEMLPDEDRAPIDEDSIPF